MVQGLLWNTLAHRAASVPDAGTQVMTIPDDPSFHTAIFTASLFFRSTLIGSTRGTLWRAFSGGGGFILGVDPTGFGVECFVNTVGDGNVTLTALSPASVVDGLWHHAWIRCTGDDGTLSAGIDDTTGSMALTGAVNIVPGEDLGMFNRPNSVTGAHRYVGEVADLRKWDIDLTDDELNAIDETGGETQIRPARLVFQDPGPQATLAPRVGVGVWSIFNATGSAIVDAKAPRSARR